VSFLEGHAGAMGINWRRCGRAALIRLDCILWTSKENAGIKVEPSAGRVRHPLQPQDRVVPRAGVEGDQNESGKVTIDTESIACAISIEAKCGPKESGNLFAL
jgi:hypothetical protein